MSNNPMLDVASMANRISSGSLERIGKIQSDTFNRRLEREKLEQQTIEREAALRVQAENYEARINDYALKAEQNAIISNNAEDIRRKGNLANALKKRMDDIQAEIPRLEMERDLAFAEQRDTSALDTAIASKRSEYKGLEDQQSQVITGLMQPSTPVPTTASQTSVIPYPQVENPDAIGFDRYGDEAINPTGGTDARQYYGPDGSIQEITPVELPPVEIMDGANRTRADVEYNKTPANIRYNNPAAAYPHARDVKYGLEGYGIIGGGHQIGKFPSVVHGAAANMDLLNAGYKGLTIRQATNKWRGRGGTPIPKGYTADQVIDDKFIGDKATMVDFFQKMAKHEHPRFSASDQEISAAYDMFRLGGDREYRAAIGASTEIDLERVGDPEVDSNLILNPSNPNRPRDSYAPIVVATPIIEEDPELVANVDFFSSMDGDTENQVRFSDSGPVGTPAQPADFVYDNFFDPVDAAQSPTGAPQPKENPVNMEFISRINSRYEALPERDKALYLSRVQETIRRSNPSVADDEITRRATIAVKSGTSSSADFRNSLPPEITNIIGDARPAEIFNRIQFGIRQEEERNNQITQLERDFEDSEEKRASYALKLSNESNRKADAGFDPNAVATLQGMVDFYTNKSESLKNQRLALDPVQPEVIQEDVPSVLDEPTALDNVVDSIVPTTTPIQTDFNQSVRTAFSDLGIDPKFLTDLDLEENMGIWDKITANLRLNSNVNENATKIKNAFIYSRAEAAMNNEDREARLQGAVEYFNTNKQQVLYYAAGLQGISINDDSGRAVDLYGPLTGSGDPIVDLVTKDDQTNTLREKALLANPAILYGIIDSMLNFDTNIRTKIVQLADKERQRKLNDLQGMFGTPMQIPVDK